MLIGCLGFHLSQRQHRKPRSLHRERRAADLLGRATGSRADRLKIDGGGEDGGWGCEKWRRDLELGLAGHEIFRGIFACWPDVIFQ
jgi:hypothetical protein